MDIEKYAYDRRMQKKEIPAINKDSDKFRRIKSMESKPMPLIFDDKTKGGG